LQDVAEFSTTVRGLLGLCDWLAAHGVTHLAMEATGVYWRPKANKASGGRCAGRITRVNASLLADGTSRPSCSSQSTAAPTSWHAV
jgi:hypothetical protein